MKQHVRNTSRDRLVHYLGSVIGGVRSQVDPMMVDSILSDMLSGDLNDSMELWAIMVESWPRLETNLNKLKDGAVQEVTWSTNAWIDKGQDGATPSAEERRELIDDCLWRMEPDPSDWRQRDYEDYIRDLVEGYIKGHAVHEIIWTRDDKGVRIKAMSLVDPLYYRYPFEPDAPDVLMFNRDGQMLTSQLETFKPNHFTIAIRSAQSVHPLRGSVLRCLARIWVRSQYCWTWVAEYAQRFGIPFTSVVVSQGEGANAEAKIKEMGAEGYAVFERRDESDNPTISFSNPSSSIAGMPTGWIIAEADTQCDIVLLGQTLTTDVGDSGSRALGDVHKSGEAKMISAGAAFAAKIITKQLAPAILMVNYGDKDECPWVAGKIPEAQDDKAKAERDQVLVDMGVKLEEEWFYERHNVPIPAPDAKLLEPVKMDVPDIENQEEKPNTNKEQGMDKVNTEDVEKEKKTDVPKLKIAALKSEPEKAVEDPLQALMTNAMDDLTGVALPMFSADIRKPFESIVIQAMSAAAGKLPMADFEGALSEMSRRMPELFDHLNPEALQASIEKAMGSAALTGALSGYQVEVPA